MLPMAVSPVNSRSSSVRSGEVPFSFEKEVVGGSSNNGTELDTKEAVGGGTGPLSNGAGGGFTSSGLSIFISSSVLIFTDYCSVWRDFVRKPRTIWNLSVLSHDFTF